MRIWYPIPPLCLDRKRLLGEHVELHAIWNILTEDKVGYKNHPEVKRWKDHLPELAMRHYDLVEEMRRRGYNHKSNLLCDCYLYQLVIARRNRPAWPETWEPVENMREKLAEKLGGAK